MKEKRIYLDHAATSWPKPQAVVEAVTRCMRESGGNPGRGSHKLALRAAEEIYGCRELAAELFDTEPERVVCTGGATMGLNMAICGMLRQGDHVLIDTMAHNAVYRPVYALAAQGRIAFDIYNAEGTAEECLRSAASLMKNNTRMIISTHMSNICSHTEPVQLLGRFCREKGLLFVVDGAQSGGHIPISVRDYNITALALPGHKGLLGPQGCGLLLFGENIPDCAPVLHGGSGSRSLDPEMPPDLPEHLEAGTLPTPAIAGLHAGLRILHGKNMVEQWEKTVSLGKLFLRESSVIPGIRFHGSTAGNVLSFTLEGLLPSRTAEYLDQYGICVRSGYHCAPLAHRAVGSFDTGTVRISFGDGNTSKEVHRLLEVLEKLQREIR